MKLLKGILFLIFLLNSNFSFSACHSYVISDDLQQYISCSIHIDDEITILNSNQISKEDCSNYCSLYKKNLIEIPNDNKEDVISEGLNRIIDQFPLETINSASTVQPFCPTKLGGGFYGEIWTTPEEQYVLKKPDENISKNTQFFRDTCLNSYKNEVDYQNMAFNSFKLLAGQYDLSSSTYFDKISLQLINDADGTLKDCWIMMKKIKLNKLTKNKTKNRKKIYQNPSLPADVVRSVAQVYAIHILLAGLEVPEDLELVTGNILDESGKQKEIVTLIDYGMTKLIPDPHTKLEYKEALLHSVMQMMKNTPNVDDHDNYKIFKEEFLRIGEKVGKIELAQNIISIYETIHSEPVLRRKPPLRKRSFN